MALIVFHDDEKERDKGFEDDVGNSAGPDDGQFDKTRWSMVLGAVQSRAPCAQKALAELCGLYWRPLYAFARRRGRSPEDAQDLVQGFFEHLIGSRGLATVERSKGRFRSFLLASFQKKTGLRRRRSTTRNGHCCFCAAPPSALSKNTRWLEKPRPFAP
jgi:DNA-directed RNA polymerase specialized sigma24 family protein